MVDTSPQRGLRQFYRCSQCEVTLRNSLQEVNWHWDNFHMTVGYWAWDNPAEEHILCMSCWNRAIFAWRNGLGAKPVGLRDGSTARGTASGFGHPGSSSSSSIF